MAGLFGSSTPAPELQQTRLQPAAIPNAPSLRPQQAQTGGNLRALTEALGGLNSALGSYARVDDEIKDDPNSVANKEWLAKAQLMDRTQLMDLARTGQAEGHRVREDALNSLLGERAYADFIPAMETHFSTEFDRSTGDVSGEYDAQRQAYAEALPNDIARAAFYKLTEPHRARTIGGVTEERIATTKQQVNSTIVDGWYTRITEAARDGTIDPAEVASSIFGASEGNAAFFGLSGVEQNATIWALAQRLAADGKVDEAEALLNTPRTGSDGASLPALGTIPEYAVKGTGLIEAAKTQKAQAASEGSAARRREVNALADSGQLTPEILKQDLDSGLFDDADVARLLTQSDRNRAAETSRIALTEAAAREENEAVTRAAELMDQPGGIHRIVDVTVSTATGGTRTLTREDRIEQVRQSQEVRWSRAEEEMVAKGADPAEAKAAMVDVRQGWYVNQFVHNEEWAKTFSALPVSITPVALEKNPALAGIAAASAEQFLDLRAKSPAYADTLVSPKAREFLETYAIAREIDGLPPEEAITVASGFAAMTPMERVKTELTRAEKDSLLKQVFKGSNEDLNGNRGQPVGASLQIVEAQIDRLAARGVPMDAIEKELKGWVGDRTTTINGVLVPVQRGMSPDFPVLVERHLQSVFEEKAKFYDLDSVEDLSIAPVNGESRWMVIDKRTGMPVGSGHISPETLAGHRAEQQAEIETEIAANLAASEVDAAERKAKYDQRIEWYDFRIDEYRRDGSRFATQAAKEMEASRQRYINSHDPNYVPPTRAGRYGRNKDD